MFNGKEYVAFARDEINNIIEHINPSVDITTFIIDNRGEYISATFHAFPGMSLMIESICKQAIIDEAPIDHTTSWYRVSISKL